jgi:hypothetical protein
LFKKKRKERKKKGTCFTRMSLSQSLGSAAIARSWRPRTIFKATLLGAIDFEFGLQKFLVNKL